MNSATVESAVQSLEEQATAYLRSSSDGTMTLQQRYAVAWKLCKDIEAIAKVFEKEAASLEEPLMEQFLAEGVERVRVAGVTLYVQRQLWAGRGEGVNGGQLAATLEELDLQDFLTVNSSTISSYVREVASKATGEDHPSAEAALAALPAPLQRVLAVTERVNVRGRRTN